MSRRALYVGSHLPPNIEAYIDSLWFRTRDEATPFELIVTGNCAVPAWLKAYDRVSVARFDAPKSSGVGRIRMTARVVRRYLKTREPTVLRQITQPRWHAPGVLLGALGASVHVQTRAAASLFDEYLEAPRPRRAWLANNAVGRSIYLAETLKTPQFGGLQEPWWSPADVVVEKRIVNRERFTPNVTPRDDVFTQDDGRVLTVGRISRRKGIDRLLEVAEALPSFEFAVVGAAGNDSLAATVESTANVRRHRPVDYVEMPSVYTAADLVLSVSRLEWGGVSRAMLEGKACGLPVVAIDRGDAGEVADSVVDLDPRDIATAIGRYLD